MGARRTATVPSPRYRRPMTSRRRPPFRRARARRQSPGSPPLWLLWAPALALLGLLLAWSAGPIADASRATGGRLWEELGLGLFLAALWLGGLARLLGRPQPASGGPRPLAWRWGLAATFAAVFALGALSLYRPPWAPAGAGGRLGDALTADLARPLWALTPLASLALLWPRLLGRALLAGPALAREGWRRRLPHRAWALALSVLGLFLPREEAPFSQPQPPLEILPPPEEAYEEVPTLEPRPGVAPAPEFPPAPPPAAAAPAALSSAWQTPPIDILGSGNGNGNGKVQVDNLARARLIEEAISSFGVDAKVVQINQGPTVTQFGIEPGWEVKAKPVLERDSLGRPALNREGRPKYHQEEVSRTRVRVNRITALANDLALALAAPSIRIEAPVPGKPVIGIEVPNPVPSLVTLRSVIESTPFQKLSARSRLALALGKGVSGEPVVADLARMPHLLIAGATGSGKSVCINATIACILMHASPQEVRFILIDPKRVELSLFATLPHLAFPHIVVDLDQVVGALQAVVTEMESRYRRLAAVGARNIEGYNRHPAVTERMPHWVVIIDELADLMMSSPYEVERLICRLAQLARATGIHLVVATQRPSVDVVTGLIKANFPTRIAFAVTSQVDSRTILDGGGAEKLLGRGDMLYMPTDAARPKRLQGSYVSDQELQRLVAYWNDARFQYLRPLPHALPAPEEREEAPEEDPLLAQARELARQHSRLSASLLQRRLRVGYPRAARLLDILEEAGIVGPAEGWGSRPVLTEQGRDEAVAKAP